MTKAELRGRLQSYGFHYGEVLRHGNREGVDQSSCELIEDEIWKLIRPPDRRSSKVRRISLHQRRKGPSLPCDPEDRDGEADRRANADRRLAAFVGEHGNGERDNG